MKKSKDVGMFKLPYRRQGDCVKLLFSAHDLSKKPIKYWANVGYVNKNGAFYKITQLVKKITGDTIGNNIDCLYYYQGSRITFPFHVNWMGNKFELSLYDCFGNYKMSIGRKVSSDNERFTSEEIEQIKSFLCLQYHIVSDGYDFIKHYMTEAKNYTDVRREISEIKDKLTSSPETK